MGLPLATLANKHVEPPQMALHRGSGVTPFVRVATYHATPTGRDTGPLRPALSTPANRLTLRARTLRCC